MENFDTINADIIGTIDLELGMYREWPIICETCGDLIDAIMPQIKQLLLQGMSIGQAMDEMKIIRNCTRRQILTPTPVYLSITDDRLIAGMEEYENAEIPQCIDPEDIMPVCGDVRLNRSLFPASSLKAKNRREGHDINLDKIEAKRDISNLTLKPDAVIKSVGHPIGFIDSEMTIMEKNVGCGFKASFVNNQIWPCQ